MSGVRFISARGRGISAVRRRRRRGLDASVTCVTSIRLDTAANENGRLARLDSMRATARLRPSRSRLRIKRPLPRGAAVRLSLTLIR